MKCTKCQAELEVGAKFCPDCGQPVEEDAVTEEVTAEETAPETAAQPTEAEAAPEAEKPAQTTQAKEEVTADGN